MVINQSIVRKTWYINIDFEGYSFADGNGPFYVSGDFNNWNTEDKNYKVPVPRLKSTKSLSPIKLKIPSTVKDVEFKIFNKGNNAWMEPKSGDSLYKDNHTLVPNPFGTKNVKVEQNI